MSTSPTWPDADTAASLPAQLMSKPALYWPEFWQGLLGIPESTAEEMAREPDGPEFFLIGRRRFILTKNAIAYLERLAKTRRYVPRRYNKAAA